MMKKLQPHGSKRLPHERNMGAKPYSSSHIASVASGFTSMRLSGDVKEQLVRLLLEQLDEFVPQLEQATLEQDSERKTLGDPHRTRLTFSRTREHMIDRVQTVDSVGSAAVQAGIEHLETYLAKVLRFSQDAAERDRVATIKPRHLEAALVQMEEKTEETSSDSSSYDSEFVAGKVGGVVTAATIQSLARSMAKMPVTKEAVAELLETYTLVLEELESDIRQHVQLGRNPQLFIESIQRMKGLMTLGWMRSMVSRAAKNAIEQGKRAIDVDDIVHLDPFV